MAEKTPLADDDQPNTDSNDVKIVRGRVDSLSLYEITENELDALAKGSPTSVYLNFGIFLLSVGASFIVTLLTVAVHSTTTLVVFVVLATVGLIGGAFLLLLWRRVKEDVAGVVDTIRNRIATKSAEQQAP